MAFKNARERPRWATWTLPGSVALLLLLMTTCAQAAPAKAWSLAEQGALSERLQHTFDLPVFEGAGLVVLSGDGTTLFDRNQSLPLIPASTQKLFTAIAALERLGPAQRRTTRFVALSQPHDGTIDGPLWLVGDGDPYLTRDDLRNGVAMLARRGVRMVTGPLVIDDSLFAGSETNGHWAAGDIDDGFAAPLSALSLDQGTAELHVSATLPGEPVRVTVLPSTGVLSIARVPATSEGGSGYVDFVRDPQRGDNAFEITGSLAPGEEQKLWVPVRDFRSYVADVTVRLLRERGITVGGAPARGVAPLAGVELWAHVSTPVARMLVETLNHSNNHAAEQLLRLAGSADGFPGSDERGLAAVRSELELLGVQLNGVEMVDGSGLSPANRLTPLALAQAIRAELARPAGAAFLNALPLVGKQGTVKDRQVQSSLGRARAKTGHLQGVNALAGTVVTRTHGRVSFAFIVNDPGAWAGEVETRQDDALDVLAEF